MSKTLNLTLKIWRQKGPEARGRLETNSAENISTEMSFLEMLDIVNEQLTLEGKEPVAFDHDCREGICGSCSMNIDRTAATKGWKKLYGKCNRPRFATKSRPQDCAAAVAPVSPPA